MRLKLRDNTTTAILINKGKRKLKLNKYFQHSTTSGTSPTLPTNHELSTALRASHTIGLILTATLQESTISLVLEVRSRLKDIQGHTAGQCSTKPLQQPPRERIWKAMSFIFPSHLTATSRFSREFYIGNHFFSEAKGTAPLPSS